MNTPALDSLLQFVARHLSAQLAGTPAPSRSELLIREPEHGRPGGCFVTYRNADDGELLGCLGCVEPRDRALVEIAEEMAVAAATRDPRFTPIPRRDLSRLQVSVTVLGPEVDWPHPRDPEKIEIGVEGLSVSAGARRGLLLPQVAVEWGYDGEQFLAATCQKAGLDENAWLDPSVDVARFRGDEASARLADLL